MVETDMNMKKYITLFGILLICTLAQITADLYIPSLIEISEHFGTDLSGGKFTITIFLFAMAFSQLFWGPLSDHYGRKHALVAGLVLALCGSILCLFAASLKILILGRFLQGLGTGACAGIWRAIFRDLYTGPELARMGSYFSIFCIFAVASAPVLGGFLQCKGTWTACFLFLAIYIAAIAVFVKFGMPETSPSGGVSKKKTLHAYKELLSSRIFMGNALCAFLTYGAMFSWVTLGAPILIKGFGLNPMQFGQLAFFTSASMLVGSLFNARSVRRFGTKRVLFFGWTVILLSGLFLALVTVSGRISPLILVFGVMSFYLGSSFIFANTFAEAFAPFGHIAGTASGLYSFFQVAGGTFFSAVLAFIPGTSVLPLAIAFMLAAILAIVSYLVLVDMVQYSSNTPNGASHAISKSLAYVFSPRQQRRGSEHVLSEPSPTMSGSRSDSGGDSEHRCGYPGHARDPSHEEGRGE